VEDAPTPPTTNHNEIENKKLLKGEEDMVRK
jgi:hypothetical protein